MQWQPRKGKDDPRSRYKQTGGRKLSVPRVILALALAAVLLFGMVKIIGYAAEWIRSRNSVKDLRELYYNAPTQTPVPATLPPTAAPTEEPPTPTPAASQAPSPSETPFGESTAAPALTPSESAPAPSPWETAPVPTETALPLPTAAPTPAPTLGPTVTSGLPQTPIPKLDPLPYPDNEGLEISSRFKALQRESKYIVGWLNVNRLVDEPVMQRNNVFYLNHDVNGKTNVNGALFLDASANLKTRPYSLVIYGHNMKSGAMFGSLRNFENSTYYHRSPFITFDTLYEDGRYVIFAVGIINVEEEDSPDYVDFFDLYSTAIGGRQKAIATLIGCSVHTCTIDVSPEDQLLLLVTCVDNDNERRVVAARRVRDTETESELRKLVQKTRKK
ncbi:MAG: sortase [Clostridia bacterium]|nr:sortase [Clostridia bacterium]